MSSENPLEEARRWLSSPKPQKTTKQKDWTPIIVLVVSLLLAAWWWWAQYSYRGENRGENSLILEEMKRGAKSSVELVVKPNGTVVAR